jgi:DNA-binding Xre family transcriptional regulator
MGLKKLEIEKWINLKDAKLIAENKKPIKTKRELSKRLKHKFPLSKHLYEQIRRLETHAFDKKYNKELVAAICEILEVTPEEIIVDAER